MISCKADKQALVEPILGNFGKVFYTGAKPGQAQVAKLANNILAAGVMVMTSEVMAMGVKAGLDPTTLLEIIQSGSGKNTAAGDKFPRCVLTGKFDFGFAIGLSLQGCAHVCGRGRGHGRAHGGRRGGAPDARHHQRQVRGADAATSPTSPQGTGGMGGGVQIRK